MIAALFASAAQPATENPNGVQDISPGLERLVAPKRSEGGSDYPGLKAKTLKARCRRPRARLKRKRVYLCFPFPFRKIRALHPRRHQTKSNHCTQIQPLLVGFGFSRFRTAAPDSTLAARACRPPHLWQVALPAQNPRFQGGFKAFQAVSSTFKGGRGEGPAKMEDRGWKMAQYSEIQ
jgi:hypothetical protein